METRQSTRFRQVAGAPPATDLRPWELCWHTDGKLYIGVGNTDGHATSVQQISGPGAGVAWGDLTGIPVYASRWPAWGEVTGKPSFATVATTGAYSDLSGTPTLGTLASKDDAAYNSTYYARRYQSWYALGSVVVYNTGTSGGTVPLLSGTNTWSGKQTFNGGIGLGGTTSQYVRGDGSLATLPSSTLIAYTTGDDSAFGVDAMVSISSPGSKRNTAVGSQAMKNMVASGSFSGQNNTAVGYQSMFTADGTGTFTCNSNAVFGTQSAYSLTTGNYNAVFGTYSAYSLTTGNSNAAFGYQAGRYAGSGTTANQTPEKGVFVGYNSRASADGNTNEIVIGADAIGNGSNTAMIGSASTTDTYLAGTAHADGLALPGTTSQYVRGDGSLATLPSGGSGTVTSVSAGNGMNFSTFTTSGTVTLGTPSTCTASTSNATTSTSHTHAITGFLPLTGGTLTGTLTGTTIQASTIRDTSDRRLKRDIMPLHDCAQDIMRLQPVRFRRAATDSWEIGFVAQDVGKVYPETVGTVEADDGTEYATLAYQRLIAPLIETVQRQQERIEALEAKLEAMQ